ncbi:MAG: lipopolysaccharide heptosyltransferase II [Thermodesulfovibrionales bacterium]|nr:lipopolysaccharide heptosyltransferase II [Thermodesulfovibrionales bacterium]
MVQQKILIRGVNWVGDAVMTLPSIEAIKVGHPQSEVSLLVKPSVIPIFQKQPYIDNIIPYSDSDKGIIGKTRLLWNLKKMCFDKAYLLQNAFDAGLISFFSGIKERIGYDRDNRGWLLTKKIPYEKQDRKIHHIDYFLNIPVFDSIHPQNKELWIFLDIQERLQARQSLSNLNRPILGICGSAAFGRTKMWLADRFAEVANWFCQKTGGSVVLFSNDAEDMNIYEIQRRLVGQYISLAGKTTLREFISLVSECDIILTNDSGPLHIAKAVMTPTIGIFTSTDPRLTGYNEKGFKSIRSPLSCSPCFKKRCPQEDMRCVSSISSDEVFFELIKLKPRHKAVFFDRDGTLCEDAHYLSKWDDFKPYNLSDLQKLKDAGYLLIGITNQSGISRGIVKEDFVKEVNNYFIQQHKFDAFYYCPHMPDSYCRCRKPEPGLLLQARLDFGIDLKQSYFVGDKVSDILSGESVGAKGILIGKDDKRVCVNNIQQAVKLILHSQ